MKTKLLSLVGIACLSIAQSAFAINNGGFDGNLTFWTTIGDVAARNGGAFLTNSAINTDDAPTSTFNFSGTSSVGSNQLETFSNLPDFALDPDSFNSVSAFEGSALKQTFTIPSGGALRFTWRLFTNELAGSDYAYVVIDDSITQNLITLANSSAATGAGALSYARTTGTNVFLGSTVVSDTMVTVTFGVVDVNDVQTSSALLVDSVTIPEPSTVALLGLAGLTCLFRRRSSAAAR